MSQHVKEKKNQCGQRKTGIDIEEDLKRKVPSAIQAKADDLDTLTRLIKKAMNCRLQN